VFFAPFARTLMLASVVVDPGEAYLAVDVFEVPLSAGLWLLWSGGGRFDLLAAVLPYPVVHSGCACDQ